MIKISNVASNKKKFVDLVKIRKIPKKIFISKCYKNFANPLNILKDLRILQKLRHDNILACNACTINGTSITLYFDYFPHSKFKEIYLKMDIYNVKFYMKNLFSTLQYLHKNTIIHGDIKPDNFLYNHNNKRFKLIDFEKSQDTNKINIHVLAGTQGYIAPEMLLDHNSLSPGSDIWSAGVILASFMSGCYPFFNVTNDGSWKISSIMQIASILGISEFINLAQNMSISIITNVKLQPKNLFETFLELRNDADDNKKLERNDIEMGCRFLEQILLYDPNKRIDATTALVSSFLVEECT